MSLIHSFRIALIAILSLALAGAAQAVTRTWDGGVADDSKWTTATNWLGDVAPVATDALQFAGTNDLTPNNDFAVNTSFSGIEFAAGAGSFAISGNGIVLTGDINNNSGLAQSINFTPVNVTQLTLTYQAGGLVLDGATSNVNVAAGGSLSLGRVTFGTQQSANVSTMNINNSVSMGGLTVQTKSVSANNINIAAGQTLTINGSVFLGTPATTANAGNVNTNLNFNNIGGGAGGGNLSVGGTNPNFFVGLGSDNLAVGGDRNVARVDMRNLSSFSYSTGTTGTGLFGVGWGTRPDAQLRLSPGTNTIVADVIGIGNSGVTGTTSSPNNDGATSTLFLGASTNVINADNINIGIIKGRGSLQWDAAVTTGTLAITAQDGVGRANITLANQTSATGAGAASTLNLGGGTHSVNILAETIILGRLGGATGGTINGAMSFDAGTVDVNSLQLAVNVSGATAATVNTVGTFTMNGGTLTVNNALILGNDTNASVTGGTQGTFTLNGGNATINAPITRAVNGGVVGGVNGDMAILNVAGGTLNVTNKDIATSAIPLTAVNISGGTLANAARINANAITITNTPTFSGTPIFVLVNNGATAATLNTPGLTLASGQSIEGGGATTAASITGDVTLNAAGRLDPGFSGTAGALTFNQNLIANNGAVLHFDLSPTAAPATGNDRLSVTGNLTLSGTVNVEIGALSTGPAIGQTYTLMSYAGTLTGDQTNLSVGTGGTRKTFTITDTSTTPGTVQMSVGGSGPLALTWIGNVNAEWDLIGDANWDSSGAQQFFNGDNLTFNDTSTNTNDVQLIGTLTPGSITVDQTRNYTFAGTGSITGSTGLTKNGSGTLTIGTANSYSGVTAINGGIVSISASNNLGSASATNTISMAGGTLQSTGATVDLTSNRSIALGTGGGTIDVTGTNSLTAGGVISGAAANPLTKTGTGTLILGGTNTYSGVTNINGGIVRLTNTAGLGSSAAGSGTTINGGTLDINGLALNTTEQFNVQGTGAGGIGAIVNNGAGTTGNNISRFTLTGNASIGGTGRWDFRNNSPVIDLAGFTLTKVGANQISVVAGTIQTTGQIVVESGALSLESTTTAAGPGTITYKANTVAQFFQNANTGTAAAPNSAVSRPTIVDGSGVVIGNAGGTEAFVASNLELHANTTFVPLSNGVVSTTANNPHTWTGNITESGGSFGITKDGNNSTSNVLTLTGTNTYTGTTTIQGGVLRIGSGGTAGTLGNGGNVVNNSPTAGALTFNRSDDITVSNAISGSGALTKTGAGTLILTGTNTYTGLTAVTTGTLLVNGAHSGGAGYTISPGATLGGSGTITSTVPVTFNGNSTLSPGGSIGTLAINTSVVLNSASILAMELNGGDTTPGGTVNDLVSGVTDLILAGNLNVTDTPSGSFASAVAGNKWKLITYSGNLTNNGLMLGTVPALDPSLAFSIDTSTGGEVDLLVVSAVPEANAFLAIGVVALGTWAVAFVRRGKA